MSEQAELKLLKVLSHHHGKARALGMAALYTAVYGEPWVNKINDTRRLRELITGLRNEGLPICSVCDRDGGGYYLASAGSDLDDYCRRLHAKALKMLRLEARLKRTSLPELLGQISIALAREAQ